MPSNDKRFQNGAQQYAAYLETPEGQLRGDLVFANLQDFLPRLKANKHLSALDIGCGTGAAAARLAPLGFHITQLDSSQAMLDIARRTADEAPFTNRVKLVLGDVAQLSNLFGTASFDVVLCHNILEYVEDPGAVLRGAARALRDSSAILSVLVRNQAGEVMKTAIRSGNLETVEASLNAKRGGESLYRGSVRLFRTDEVLALLKEARIEVIARRGVRVVADYLSPQISREAEYERILDMERKLGQRPEFADVARYVHYLASRASPVIEDVV